MEHLLCADRHHLPETSGTTCAQIALDCMRCLREAGTMRYEDFLATWTVALQEAGLPLMGPFLGEQTLDLRSLERRYEVYVQPLGGQDAKPFHVAAKLSWSWDALKTARSRSTEEDALRELLGVTRKSSPRTERPWLRVDVALCASLPYGKPLPMPGPAKWSSWVREVGARLENIEPLVPEKKYRINKRGGAEVLAFQGAPEATFSCQMDGRLTLEQVKVEAWQAVKLPRIQDDSERADPPPDRELRKLFERVRAAAFAWKEALDHLATAKE
jgi:hypothetical protein